MIERSAILSVIRGMLCYDSTAPEDVVVDAVTDRSGIRGHHDRAAVREIVRFAVEEMLLDGGLRRNERGWVYCPQPEGP